MQSVTGAGVAISVAAGMAAGAAILMRSWWLAGVALGLALLWEVLAGVARKPRL